VKIHRKENDWQPGQNAFLSEFNLDDFLPPGAAEGFMNVIVAKFKKDNPGRKIITCHITFPPASVCVNYTEESK
jgi:hypothetical protein